MRGIGVAVLLVGSVGLQGQTYSKWYEAWQQGEIHRSQGAWAQALSAYRQAAQLHPKPEKRTITYGTNTLNDYYPYQRMAECHLQLKQLAQADAAFTQSRQMGEPESLRTRLQPLLEELKRPAPEVKPAAALVVAQPQVQPQVQPQTQPVIQPPPSTPAVVTAIPVGTKPTAADPQVQFLKSEPKQTIAPTVSAIVSPTSQPSGEGKPPPPSEPVAEVRRTRGSWLFGGGLMLPIALGAGLIWNRRRKRRSAIPLGSGPSFGRFQIMEILGKGGCGITYRAVDTQSLKLVAIKVPHAHLLEDPDFKARFRQEAELGAHLEHPNSLGIPDPGPSEGPPWIAMQLV